MATWLPSRYTAVASKRRRKTVRRDRPARASPFLTQIDCGTWSTGSRVLRGMGGRGAVGGADSHVRGGPDTGRHEREPRAGTSRELQGSCAGASIHTDRGTGRGRAGRGRRRRDADHRRRGRTRFDRLHRGDRDGRGSRCIRDDGEPDGPADRRHRRRGDGRLRGHRRVGDARRRLRHHRRQHGDADVGRRRRRVAEHHVLCESRQRGRVRRDGSPVAQ